ncbi:hypothetical protein [Streptococcus caballi]|uniref:hypothetical protein n=1 Tax=Streptococcus caballi TaxID=439220 RepID=UPI00037DBBEA|nr:hypothetical protein [Streptococcus caballi]
MDKGLLLVVIFLGIFSIIKVIMIVAYSFIMKPKVDENGNFIKPAESRPEKKKKDDFWDDDDW